MSTTTTPTPGKRLEGPGSFSPLETAQSLVSVLAGEAARTETDRRLTDVTLQALRRSGLFRLGSPVAHGGLGAGVRTAVEVCESLAHGCAASSWLVGIAYGGNLLGSRFDPPEVAAIWGQDPDAIVCGTADVSEGTALRTDGGWILNGRWPWISGINYAQWTLLSFTWTDDGGNTERSMALVRTRDLGVHDGWHVAGMRGTGPNTAVAIDVYVPESRTISLTYMTDGSHEGRHCGATRSTPHLSVNLPLAGSAVGVASAALQQVVTNAGGQERSSARSQYLIGQVPSAARAEEAAKLIDLARLHLVRAADQADHVVRTDRRLEFHGRARIRMDAAKAVRCAREAVGGLLDSADAQGRADGSVLQRAWRDIEVASRHAAFSIQANL
ncbi:acyl-CoA dehydrogenase family protein [Streptomyces sp. NPDC060030]|uniref:acyl-CoA dehydrogenase family protein n=1 Tax=Streptomyces sp. NPDC060030 TaxID=3347042 RepID=UPI003681C720